MVTVWAKMLFFLFIMFLNLCSCQSTSELELLQSIKSSLNDPLKTLSSWNSSLHFCKWDGISCNNSSTSHVVQIELSGKNLSGKISDKIFEFPYVEKIDLSNNQLFGEIPGNLSSCLLLKYFNLSNNNFTGQIPRGSNQILETYDLSNNMISGKIPEEIGFFSGLKFLDFGGNILEGIIPKSITNVTSLEFLTLSSNKLIGEIPSGLGLIKKLKLIYLGYNNLSGGIPKELGELTSLYHLDLVYNNLTGEIPFSLGNLTNLQYLFLYLNKLNGPIPKTIFSLKKLISLDLSGNFLSGEIPEIISNLQQLEVLHLFSNNITGKIPRAISFLPHLQVLQLWSNRFYGDIPNDLGKYNNLTILDLSTNNLTGKIPETLCGSGRLFKLILFSNSIEGRIPMSLANCKSLQRIRLQNNNLSGELPMEFPKLPLVYFLDISGNNLYSSIGELKWNMPELQMLNLARNKFSGYLPDSFGSKKLENLDLSENDFSGTIPPRFGEFKELVELKLNDNKLSGKIPNEICLCMKLVTLDLSQNQLNGEIPPNLSNMPVLGQLDLSMNQFSGEIPRKLGTAGSLIQVNVSYNHLHGSLPSTGAFLAINSSALTGNDLCGGDETSGLPPCKPRKTRTWWFLLTCLLSVMLACAFTGFIIFVISQPRIKESELTRMDSEDGIWELQFLNSKASKSISIKDILASPREENLIKRGKNQVSYKGNSAANNMMFVAKVFSDANSFPTSSWLELDQQLGKIHHPNIVKLIATCKSKKGLILVYEYIEGKNLSEALRDLNWERRKKVVLGVAKSLRYLHCYCSPNIPVSDLSPHKIIVDLKDEAHLRLPLPKLAFADNKFFISSAYAAPETVTEKSDIYSLGLILIELLTGKNSTDAEFGIHESMIEWARYCYSDCHLEMWVDPTIKNALQNYKNEIVETMNLALQCTASDPKARPSAIDVVKTLELVAKSSVCGLSSKVFF